MVKLLVLTAFLLSGCVSAGGIIDLTPDDNDQKAEEQDC